jgi:hypothetical protein
MATKPPAGLLEIGTAKAGSEEISAAVRACLGEIVCYGLAALSRCQHSLPGVAVSLPPIRLLRHVLECVDGVRILVEEACPGPTGLLVRSGFETWLCLRYMLEDDVERRSYAWLVCESERRG